MADFVRVPESDWQGICDAVREKTGGAEMLLSGEIAAAVAGIETEPVLEELTVTENGEYTPGEGVDGFSRVVAKVEGARSDGDSLFQVVDVVVDNTSVGGLSFPVDDAAYDNYIVQYACIETGVYTDDVLAIDETPTFPLGNNLPMLGAAYLLDENVEFSGYLGTALLENYILDGTAGVARGSLSTYGSSGHWLSLTDGTMVIRSQYSFGKSGYRFKFRVNVFGWNNPEVSE